MYGCKKTKNYTYLDFLSINELILTIKNKISRVHLLSIDSLDTTAQHGSTLTPSLAELLSRDAGFADWLNGLFFYNFILFFKCY